MKTISILFLILIASFSLKAQDITGQWNGILQVQGIEIRLVFHVNKTEKGYSSTMDSPDQGTNGIPITITTFEDSKIKFEITAAQIEYTGELVDNEFIGTYKQGVHEIPLNLSRTATERAEKPQEPKKPYPYYTEEVTFQNPKAKITLAGTLSLPKKEGKFPVVVMITGSGPQNRDEEILGHKPFLVIADYLTKNGIGVLRYDDRGIGESKGNFGTATSADFASDVESAIAYLKTRSDIDKTKMGLIGHSEGGLIAPMVAVKSKDVSFIVLLAGPGIQGDEIILLQQKLIGKADGESDEDLLKTETANKKIFDIIKSVNDTAQLKKDLTNSMTESLDKDTSIEIPEGSSKEDFIKGQVDQLTSPWILYFLRYNPEPTLEKVKCAVLAVNGEKDLQVPPKENLAAIQEALTKGGNKNFTTKEFPGLNHLFQECTTGSPEEYAKIEQTFSPKVLQYITNWIKSQIN